MNTEKEKEAMRLKQRICDALKTLPRYPKEKWEACIQDNMVTLETCADKLALCQLLETLVVMKLRDHCQAWAAKDDRTKG